MLLNNEQRELDISNIQHFMEIWSLVVTNITDHLETSNRLSFGFTTALVVQLAVQVESKPSFKLTEIH